MFIIGMTIEIRVGGLAFLVRKKAPLTGAPKISYRVSRESVE
jgi:hypothetical protein